MKKGIPLLDESQELSTFERMPRPGSQDEFLSWLVPARNNIQREMLRLRGVLAWPAVADTPAWVFEARHHVLGACFSLWRSVFQASEFSQSYLPVKEGKEFLEALIKNNAATYSTELNAWSLEFYIENAVYRLNAARALAIEAGVDPKLLPVAKMLRTFDDAHDEYGFPVPSYSPYAEWELCYMGVHALIKTMRGVLDMVRI
jgi:hypothetical protein